METLTSILKHVKRKLGIISWYLPVEEEDLLDVIREETLKTFSIFYPLEYDFRLDLKKDVINEHEKIYHLDFDKLPANCSFVDINKITFYRYNEPYLLSPFSSSTNFIELIEENLNNNLMSTIDTPVATFKFIPPNKLQLFNFYFVDVGSLIIKLFITHPDNLSTLPPTVMTFFKKLAVLDIKAFLYNMLKHYTNIETAYGTIDLKIDDWAEAESLREEMVDKLKENQIFNPQFDKYFFF